MRILLTRALLTVVGLSLAFSSALAEEASISGAEIYAQTCNRCHGFRSPVEFTDARWSVIVTHMRVVAGIPADETRAVLKYLRANNNPTPPVRVSISPLPVPGDPVASGRTLVLQRGCVGCHTVDGTGGVMGPALNGVTTRRDDSFILTQLLNPRLHKADSLMPNLGLTEPERTAILAYLKTLQAR